MDNMYFVIDSEIHRLRPVLEDILNVGQLAEIRTLSFYRKRTNETINLYRLLVCKSCVNSKTTGTSDECDSGHIRNKCVRVAAHQTANFCFFFDNYYR